jgi:hypothetical protein
MQYHKKRQDLNLEIQNQVTFSYMLMQEWGQRRQRRGGIVGGRRAGGFIERAASSSNGREELRQNEKNYIQ